MNYKIKKQSLIKICVAASAVMILCSFSQTIPAQSKSKKVNLREPRTVYDFYLKVPVRYFPFLARLKDRADFVESNDEKNDYLRFGANVPFPPEHAEMALLKRMNGGFYVVISYTDDDEAGGRGVLRFLEYGGGKFSEAEGASIVDLKNAREIYRRKTGRETSENEYLFYRIEPASKTVIVALGEIEIYKSEWDGNFYDFTAPVD